MHRFSAIAFVSALMLSSVGCAPDIDSSDDDEAFETTSDELTASALQGCTITALRPKIDRGVVLGSARYICSKSGVARVIETSLRWSVSESNGDGGTGKSDELKRQLPKGESQGTTWSPPEKTFKNAKQCWWTSVTVRLSVTAPGKRPTEVNLDSPTECVD